jgi:hypothetical protein
MIDYLAIERMARRLESADVIMTPAPWSAPPEPRLIGTVDAIVDGVTRQVACAVPDAAGYETRPGSTGDRILANAHGIVALRNTARPAAEMLRAVMAELAQLEEQTEVAARAIAALEGIGNQAARQLAVARDALELAVAIGQPVIADDPRWERVRRTARGEP